MIINLDEILDASGSLTIWQLDGIENHEKLVYKILLNVIPELKVRKQGTYGLSCDYLSSIVSLSDVYVLLAVVGVDPRR